MNYYDATSILYTFCGRSKRAEHTIRCLWKGKNWTTYHLPVKTIVSELKKERDIALQIQEDYQVKKLNKAIKAFEKEAEASG